MRLRPPAHRCSTAHLRAAYPFLTEGGLGGRGTYIGTEVHGGSFCYDPWELYPRNGSAGILTCPNMLVAGQIGKGKSAFVKTYVWRQAVFGRRAAILDPKGEYGPLADALGVKAIRLSPGGGVRLNPLDPGPSGGDLAHEEIGRRQLVLLQSLAAAGLGRSLTPEERTACDLALREVSLGAAVPTLMDVVEVLLAPSEASAKTIHTTPGRLAEASREVALELRRLCEGDLRGMFDGQTSVDVDWDGPAVILDLSEVFDSDALGLLMTCASAWLGAVISRPQAGQRIVVVDEAWAVLANVGIARWLRALVKLSRAVGVQVVVVIHRLSDLLAAGAEGSEQERLARGLLSDTETRVIYCQPAGEVLVAESLLGLSKAEASLLRDLPRSRGLWKVGGHSHLVDHILGAHEFSMVDTDARMRRAA